MDGDDAFEVDEDDSATGFSVGDDLETQRSDRAEESARRASRREISSEESRKAAADEAEDMTSRLLRAKRRASGDKDSADG